MKKFISIILICCLLIQFSGCYTPQMISKEELILKPTNAGMIAKTKQQIEYGFERGSYVIIRDTIRGSGYRLLENGKKVEVGTWQQISLENVESIKVEEIDVTKTILLGAVGVGLGVLLALGIKSWMKDATGSIASGIGEGLQ